MDQRDLFICCRSGDLERIKYLVEEKDVELNMRDQWDSTPLYYACLCGHYEVVRYLLEQGAKCEANTFDGERCLYGALNSEIKHLLLHEYKVISSKIIRRDLYYEFLRKLLESGEYADVCFEVHGQQFYGHKCILAARSAYFYEQFLGRWRNRSVVHIRHEQVNPVAFEAIMQYIYTGRLEIHVDNIKDLARLARQCKMQTLMERLEDQANKTHVFERMKPGTHVTMLVLETQSDNFELQTDFGVLAEEALPLDLCNWVGASELPFFPEIRAPFADIIFEVENHRFHCHRAFFCSRSEYFKTVLRDPFHEQEQNGDDGGEESELRTRLPVVKLHNLSPSIFAIIVYYMYQEAAQMDVETVFDVLVAADICLLLGLKRQCGVFMAKYLDVSNVCNVLRTARMFDLPRLEYQCYQYMAERIEQVLELEEFHQIILEDASEVQGREYVDSIDVVDNIRFHLTANSIDEAHDKLEMIDCLLERLNLNA